MALYAKTRESEDSALVLREGTKDQELLVL